MEMLPDHLQANTDETAFSPRSFSVAARVSAWTSHRDGLLHGIFFAV